MGRCKWYQWRIRRQIDSNPAGTQGRLARHLQRCADCRDVFERHRRLEAILQRPSSDALTAAQHARIEAAVLRQLEETRPRAAAAGRRSLLPAGAVAAAAMLLLTAYVFLRHARPLIEVSQEPTAARLPDAEQMTQRISQWAFLPEAAMQAEMLQLAEDARNVMAFLLDCTPGHPHKNVDNGL